MGLSRSHFKRSLLLMLALTVIMSLLVSTAMLTRRRASERSVSRTEATPPTASHLRETYGRIPLSFEANQGQTDASVNFLARGAGYTLFLKPTEAVFALRSADCGMRNENAAPSSTEFDKPHSDNNPQSATHNPQSKESVICDQQSKELRMRLVGADAGAAVEGADELAGKVNYFNGNDPAEWRTDVPTYGRVRYAEVYPGIDVIYYGNGRQLEYDFRVAPGRDARAVSIQFDGADKLEVDADGDLLLTLGESVIRQPKPFMYQEVAGARRGIEGGYVVGEGGRVSFAVGEYDTSAPLVIDPVLVYSTYLGGSRSDGGSDIAVDSAGNAYVTGTTSSPDFPTVNPLQGNDGVGFQSSSFITKLNAAGTAIIYSTYLGGSLTDGGSDIAVDSAGNAYVTGRTNSTDFPLANALQSTISGPSEAYVTKLNATGSALIYSTYLGGSDSDSGSAIVVDSAGNAYVTGDTTSTNFPTTSGAFDTTKNFSSEAFVTKLNASGTALVYSTYLGGNLDDFGFSIAVDAAGNAYVTGQTTSFNFPTTPNAFDTTGNFTIDAFVTKLNASGTALVYSTYLGGNNTDTGGNIAVDSAGNAYVTGGTLSTDFPTTVGAFDVTDDVSFDAFVTKLNASGTALVYSTYLGGNGIDGGGGIALDLAGNAYVTGNTASTDFPTTPDAFDTDDNPGTDAFVTKLNASGTVLVYSTYLGGGTDESGSGIALDAAGNAYVVGQTFSTDFPTTTDAFQTAGGGRADSDAFVAKIGDFSISGRVIDSSGNGIAGVTITLGGSRSDSTTTDAGGNFLFLDSTTGGNFTVTPFKADFTFSPESFSINSLNSNQDILFIGTASATPTPTPATFQFSAASFGAGESDGSVQIVVTRSGDTSQALTVDYATTDGTANDRGDYTTATGRLRFNAGETAKSFLVFVTDDAFVEGNETVNITLSVPSPGGQVGGSGTVILTIVDNDAATASTNPIDNTQFFVRQQYVDFLNREPDAAGFAFWVNNIESCGADAQCRDVKRRDTSAAFFLSIEFQETGFLVHRIYRASFNRLSRYREFVRDSQQLGRGVVIGQPGAEAQLEANKEALADEFVTRPEFTAIYGGLTNEQYVDGLNANTGGSLSASERDALVAGLNGLTESRATALRKVADDPDFKAREFNPAFVLLQYFGYLRRNPDDAPDTDFSGYNFWLAKLNQFNGDFRQAEMVKAFITSTEYRGRFGQQ